MEGKVRLAIRCGIKPNRIVSDCRKRNRLESRPLTPSAAGATPGVASFGRGVTLGMPPPVARVSVDVAAWEAGRIREGISGTTMRGVSRRLQRRTKSRNDRAAAVSESSARYRKLWYGPYESRESRHRGASRCVRNARVRAHGESIWKECILDCRISVARRPRSGEDHPLRLKRESRSVS